MGSEELQAAWDLLKEAYQYQMGGEYDMAVELYKRSLDLHPTAEAYTFLGWTYHFQGKIEEAIAECKKAIQVDPEFGNPYNDIGAYLIELGRHEEAIPWLQKAMTAKRYEPRHYPHFNLSRVLVKQGKIQEAIREIKAALELEPGYVLARKELHRLLGMLN